MAEDLSLLVKFRGDNSGLKATTADTRLAVSQLRHSFGTELNGAMQTLSASASALQGPMGGVASRISALTSVSAGAAGPLAIMAIGITAIAAAAYGAITAILSLAKSAADFAGEIFDLSQKTNFSAETLSALGAAAKFSGSTLDALIPSLGIFQVNMVKAAEGGNAMSKVFKQLNIDTTDQEKALRQAITALAAMGETERQTTAAKQLFGRAGLAVLGIVKETNGNLDEAIKKYDQLGFIIKDQAAAAADQFGDTLEVLSMQFTALGRTIGLEVLPVLTVFMEDMSSALTGSRENWAGWAEFVKSQVLGVTATVEALAIYIASMGTLSPLQAFDIAYDSLAKRSAEAGIAAEVIAATRRAAGGSGVSAGAGGGKAKTKRDEIYQAEIQAAKEAHAVALEVERHATEQLKLVYEQSIFDLEQYYTEKMRLSEQHHDDIIVQINAEQVALDAARARGLIKTEEADAKDRELTRRNEEAKNKAREEYLRLSFEREQKRDAFALALDKQLFDIRQATREGERNRIKELESKKAIDESQAIAQRMALMKEEHSDRLVLLNEELELLTTTADRKTEIDSEKLASEQRYTDAYLLLTQQRMDAMARELHASLEFDGGPIGGGKLIIPPSDAPPPPDFHPWITAFEQVRGVGLEAMGALTQGIASMVQAWVLYGNAGPNAVRKMVASVLAGLAAQAAIEALMELAKGFAALANPLMAWTAPAHFKAAALFGLVAGGAAIAGRMVAGNSFSQGAGGGGSGGGSGAATSTAPSSIDVGRRKSEGVPAIYITVVGQATEGFRYMVEKAAIESVRSNGPMRRIQNGEDV